MIDFGYNNKKTNIKVNILLAAFLEIELYDNIDCHVMINSLFKKNIGIWSYIHKTDDGSYRLRIYVDSDNKMKKDFNKVADIIKNNSATDGATFINEFINDNEIYYDVKNVIEAAIKNNDIDIEKLCESLNL